MVLRDDGVEDRFPCVRQAIDTVELVARRLFENPAWRVVVDPAGDR
jgi:hypothetical protein